MDQVVTTLFQHKFEKSGFTAIISTEQQILAQQTPSVGEAFI
jgi:hypothetical protein